MTVLAICFRATLTLVVLTIALESLWAINTLLNTPDDLAVFGGVLLAILTAAGTGSSLYLIWRTGKGK